MTLETILEVIEKVYSSDHILMINMNGICGIESISGVIEIDFKNLDELYDWVKDKELNHE